MERKHSDINIAKNEELDIEELHVSRRLLLVVIITISILCGGGYVSSLINQNRRFEQRISILEKKVEKMSEYVTPRQKQKKFLFF